MLELLLVMPVPLGVKLLPEVVLKLLLKKIQKEMRAHN
jgi:hypothetical protein